MERRKKAVAVISPATKASILAGLAEIRGKLTFLTTLKVSDVESMIGVARAASARRNGAQVQIPDGKLTQQLAVLVAEINRLAANLQDNLSEKNSDTMVAALGTYIALKREADKLPGLNLISPELAEFFKKVPLDSASEPRPGFREEPTSRRSV